MSAAMELVPLVCLFVAAWSGITSADGRPAVQLVKDNEDVVLECSLGESAQGKIFSWTKDTEEVITITPPTRIDIGQDFRGRVSHFPDALQSGNASIVIRGAKVSDSGRYICEFPNDPPETRADIFLSVESTDVKQVENEDGHAILNCSFGKSATGKMFDWRKDGVTEVFTHNSDGHLQIGKDFQNRVSHFPEALQSGNVSILIKGMKLSDNGSYTCDFPNDPPKTRANISLSVVHILKDRSAGPAPIPRAGATQMPVITAIKWTESSVLLQCLVRGALPKPHVVWQDSTGALLQAEEPQVTPRDGKYDTVLNITVTKSGTFKCNVTQTEIHHQIQASIFVSFRGTLTDRSAGSDLVAPSVKTLHQTSQWALIQCLVRGVSPKTQLQWKDSSQNVVPAKEPEVIKRGNRSDIILQATVTKSDTYQCVATRQNGPQTEDETFVYIGGSSNGGWTTAIVLLVIFAFCGIAVAVIKRSWFEEQWKRLRSRCFPPATPVNGRDPNTDTML